MPNTTELVDKITAQVNETVKSAQDQASKAVADWTETIENFIPETVSSLDLVENLPKPAALVDMAFDFTQKVLEYQAELARSIAGLLDNLVSGSEDADSAPAKTTKSAKASA